MVVREKFHYDLDVLQIKVNELGKFAIRALEKSMIALESKDIDLSLDIIDSDTIADVLEEEINDFAILLIAKQQPVAIDLRRIIVAIKIVTDLERIADFAVNIAKATIRIGNEPFIKSIDNLKQMHMIAEKMLKLSLESFVEEDVMKAKKVAELDDEVDSLYGQTIMQLLGEQNGNTDLGQITQLSFVARYLERAADHTTNIAESIFYLVKGRHYDLNE